MIKEKLRSIPIINSLINYAQKVSLPGFDKVPVYDVLVYFFKEMQKKSINIRASALAFNFFLALFPAIIFLFTLIPYIPIDHFIDDIFDYLKQLQTYLPGNIYELVYDTVKDTTERQHGGLLSFGFIATLYFATNGISTMMDDFDKTNESFVQRSFLKKKIIAFLLTVAMAFMFVLSVIFIVGGEYFLQFIFDYLNINSKISSLGLTILRWMILILLFLNAIAMLYAFGPATKTRWAFFSPGTNLAATLCLLTSVGFAYYVDHFGQYNKIYGSLGAIIIIMVWMYLNAMIMIIGFELNAGIYVNKMANLKKQS